MPESIDNLPVTPTPVPRPPANATEAEQVGLRVSLIPSEEQERHDPRHGFKQFAISVGIFILIVGVAMGYLGYHVYVDAQTVKKLDDQTEGYKNEVKSMESSVREAKLAQSRLQALSAILDNHKTAQKVFSFLEENTLPDVAFSSISLGDNGSVLLAAQARTYEAYAAQINRLKAQPLVKGISSTSPTPTYDENGNLGSVGFSLTITFDTQILLINPPSGK